MTTPVFPTTLPGVSMGSYGFAPMKSTIRSEMDSGLPRVRRRFTSSLTTMKVKWKFTLAELGIFEKFYEVDADAGAAWFFIDLVNGVGKTTYLARFKDSYNAEAEGREFAWDVSAELEVLNRPMPV